MTKEQFEAMTSKERSMAMGLVVLNGTVEFFSRVDAGTLQVIRFVVDSALHAMRCPIGADELRQVLERLDAAGARAVSTSH